MTRSRGQSRANKNLLLAFLNSLVLFSPDDTASNTANINPAATNFPQNGHGAIALTPLFNNPADIEEAPTACGPLLAPRALRAGKSAEGVVVFDLPPGFNAERRPVRITYQPTRWGGARRVEAVLPRESFRL